MAKYQGDVKELSGTLALAYGPHVVNGHIIQKVTEGAGDAAQTTVVVWLGEGPWNKIRGAYWGGGLIDPNNYHFHNGYLADSMDEAVQTLNHATGLMEWNQGVDPWNVGGLTYSGTAYVIVKLPVGIDSDDDFGKLKFVCECVRVADYDEDGNQLDYKGEIVGGPNDDPNPDWFFYSTNAALVMTDLLFVRRGLKKSEIENAPEFWSYWHAWKQVCSEEISWVGGSIPDRPVYLNATSNFSVGANSSALKIGGGHAWNCGAVTESVFPNNTISFFEVDAGAGTWAAGLSTATTVTNSNQFYIGVQGNAPPDSPGAESGVLSVNFNGTNHVFGTWVAGNRYRFGADIVDGTPFLYIAENGVRMNLSSVGTTPPFISNLRGCVALFHEGADILRATMSPINTGVGTERTRARFDCGLAFPNQTDLAAAIEAVLFVSCSEMQDGEHLKFLPPSMETSPRLPVFDFNESNILPKTFTTYRLARDQKPTKLTGRFRDSDTPTLKEDTVDSSRDALVDLLGRENPGPETYLGTITRGQAECVLNFYMRRQSDLDIYCEFESGPTAWKVQPGDIVRISKDELNWSGVKFEVIQADDLSSVSTPDHRRFVCQIFNEAAYSDTDQTPLVANITDLVTSEIGVPATPTGFTASFLLNAVKYKWDKPANFSKIREYELWSSVDTANPANLVWHGLANGFTEPFATGAPSSITRYLRAVSTLGVVSEFTAVTQSLSSVAAPSNYTITFDNNVLHHSFSPAVPAMGIIRYEIATDAAFSTIIFSALDTHFDETVIGAGPVTRYLRAVGTLEKYSAVITSTTTVGVPAPPTAASVSYDGIILKWSWSASSSSNVDYYEITNSTGTVVLDRTQATYWEQAQVRGTSSYSSRVYTVSNAGLRSTSFLTLGYTIPAPNPVSGLAVNFDSTTGLIKWTWIPSASTDIEAVVLTDNAATLPALVANKVATSISEVPAEGVVVLRRNVTVINTNGQSSTAIFTTFVAPAPLPPVISLNRQYPSVADVDVAGSIIPRAAKNTVVKVSTGTGATFNAGIFQTLPEDGKQNRISVFGRASVNQLLRVKVCYTDVWGQTSFDSNELSLTFILIAAGDIGSLSSSNLPDGILSSAMFASGIKPIVLYNASSSALPTLPNTSSYPVETVLFWTNAADTTQQGLWRNVANVWERYINGGSIVADSITAGQIAAGAVSATEIAAGAIRADKLAVGLGKNEIINPSFEDTVGAGWQAWGGGYLAGTVTNVSDAPNGDYVNRLPVSGSATPRAIPVVPGKKYLVRCRLRSSNGTGSYQFDVYHSANAPTGGYYQAGDGATNTTLGTALNSTITSWTSETALAFVFTVPAGKYWMAPVIFNFSGSGTLDLDDFEVSPVIGGAYIADAAIGTAHIQDASITYAKIDTATINTLISHTVYADLIVAAVGDVGILLADAIVSRDYAPWVAAVGQLNGSISDSVTTITLDSTADFLSSAALQIDDEIMYYTGKTSTTFTGVTRGRDETIATTHADNAVVVAKGRGWKGNPERGTANPGAFEMHSGALIQNVPMREIQARATHSTDQFGYYRGPDRAVVQGDAITYMFIEEHFSDGKNDRTYASLVLNIDDYRSPEGTANAASVDHVEVTIRNKFGDVIGSLPVRYSAWTGRGTAWSGWYERKYADSEFEAAFTFRVHNRLGYSAPFHVSGNAQLQSSWGTFFSVTEPPTFLARQNCPLELTAVPVAPDTIKFNWSHASANAASQSIWMRLKGADNHWTSWETIATGTSSSANTYSWSNALQYTDYEFYIENTGSTGATSNIAYCKTPPQGATVAPGNRIAPSGVAGSAISATSIVWSWTVNATDNTDVEYSLDAGSWTSLSSATASTTTSTVSAGTTHTLKVRNKWSSGTTSSPEATSSPVTTPLATPASTDPSNLNLSTPDVGQIFALWINNGTVSQTLEYKKNSAPTWTTVSLSTVDSYLITGLDNEEFYNVRVRATAGTNYVTAPPVFTLGVVPDDPFCVLLDTQITLLSWLVDDAKNVVTGDVILTGKSNPSEIIKTHLGVTSSFFYVTEASGRLLGCSPSHVFLTNIDETESIRAYQIHAKLLKGERVYVKMNVLGHQFLSEVVATEHIKSAEKVWIPELAHSDHTIIGNSFVFHNARAKLFPNP
jgi:hypothetical protein